MIIKLTLADLICTLRNHFMPCRCCQYFLGKQRPGVGDRARRIWSGFEKAARAWEREPSKSASLQNLTKAKIVGRPRREAGDLPLHKEVTDTSPKKAIGVTHTVHTSFRRAFLWISSSVHSCAR